MRIALLAAAILILWTAISDANAGEAGNEITYLLDTIGTSGCIFTRNGTEHTAEEARDHLAMKLRRAGSRVSTAEQFIEYLATKSSWSGKPYQITCDGETTPSGQWLNAQLAGYRAARPDAAAG